MSEFEQICSGLITISKDMISNNKDRAEYAKSINYQITQLFQALGDTTKSNGMVILQQNKMHRKLTERQQNSLFGKQARNRNYVTPEDLCDYLHISRHNLKRNYSMQAIEEHALEQFYILLQRGQIIEEVLLKLLGQMNLQRWFGQVDFFNNGYIDTSALYEYLLHYNQTNQVFEQYNALLLIRTIKKHSHNDKLFIQDIRDYLNHQQQSIHILLTNDHLQSDRMEMLTSGTFQNMNRHLKRNSNDLPSFNSDYSILLGSKAGENAEKKRISNLGEEINQQIIQEELKQQANVTYEEILVQLHSRNQRYIRQAKRQMQGIIPICNIQINTKVQVHNSKAQNSQLILKLKLMGDIFNSIIKAISQFIKANIKFTFCNAFAQIDQYQQNSISYEQWLRYIKQIKISMTVKKVSTFYNVYSRSGKMSYSDYLKIFKYVAIEDVYSGCQCRYPLIYEQWSELIKQKYRVLLVRLIRAVQQRQILRKDIGSRVEQFTSLLSRFTYEQQVVELLGEYYKQFVHEYSENGRFNLSCLLRINKQ